MATGKTLELSELMKNGSSYVSYVNWEIRKLIGKRVAAGDLVEFEGGKLETIGDRPGFYLSGDSLVIYFQQYEYFPYVAGIQEFPIKYTELKSFFKTEYNFLYNEPVLLEQEVQNTLSVGIIAGIVLDGNPTTGYT